MVTVKERCQREAEKLSNNYTEFAGGDIYLGENMQLIIRKLSLECGMVSKKGRYKLNSSVS